MAIEEIIVVVNGEDEEKIVAVNGVDMETIVVVNGVDMENIVEVREEVVVTIVAEVEDLPMKMRRALFLKLKRSNNIVENAEEDIVETEVTEVIEVIEVAIDRSEVVEEIILVEKEEAEVKAVVDLEVAKEVNLMTNLPHSQTGTS